MRIPWHCGLPESFWHSAVSVRNRMSLCLYGTHYLSFKFYMEHGMKLTKIDPVIQFQQLRLLQPYTVKNTNLRAAAKSKMEKDFFKNMNNSIYGKTCDN